MSAKSGLNIEGVVLKRSDLGEYDRLITVYTKDHGKLILLAKSIRKPGSKRAGSLELFNRISALIKPHPSGINYVTEVKVLDSYSRWRGQLGRVALAYQAVESVDKLTPEALTQSSVYELLVGYLQEIGNLGVDWREKTLANLKKLLELLGHVDPENQTSDLLKTAEEAAGRPIYSAKLIARITSKPLIK